jgi:hypothetical protein
VFLASTVRSVSRLSFPAFRIFAVLALSATVAFGQDTASKHYLTFQIGYRGTASKSSQDASGQSETSVEVKNLFSGRIEVRPTEAYDLPTDRSEAAQLKRMETMQAAVLAGDADKLTKATPPLLVTWFPQGDRVDVTGRISETKTSNTSETAQGESRESSGHGTESYKTQKVCEGDIVNAFVKIHPEEKRYDLRFTLMLNMATTMEAGHQTLVSDHKEEGHDTHAESEANVPLDTGPGQMALGYSNYQMVADVKGLPLAGDAGELIGTTRIPVPKPAGWDGAWDIALEVSWQIDVTLPPVELVITIPGYDEWRPEGNIKEVTKPGNKLVARATVVPKAGQGTFVPRVKNIRFQLLDTSREPGVCMNWPLNAKDKDYDLRLATVSGGTLSKSDQKLEVIDPRRNDQGQPYAEAQIDSYDFGGRASLRAVCLLTDGREIEGVMKDVGEIPRLPKMKNPGWIADCWKKVHDVEKLADDDDNEKIEGQKDNGDGFTLYEEYRGWVENGKHIEGDPLKKDLFVRNEIGQDAKGGIKLFERVSKLRVHSRLLPSEIIELPVDETQSVAAAKGERIMNLNRRDAPQRVKQHAVRMMVGRHQGGATIGFASQEHFLRAFRPKSVRVVQLEPRDDPNAILTVSQSVSAYNLSERDAAFAYDRGVAHELLHVVGVDHHGEGEDFHTFNFQSASDPNNPTHHVRFTPMAAGTYEELLRQAPFDRPRTADDLKRDSTVTLIWEDTKQDVAESIAADFERELAAERSNRAANPPADDPGGRATRMPYYGKDANYWRETDLFDSVVKRNPRFNIAVTIGELGKADSGNELCLMRYYFANAYPVSGREKTYYLVRPGADANRAGRELCKSPEGTIHNASSHSPQPRFGDSASGRGDCFSQICPNDDIPARRL